MVAVCIEDVEITKGICNRGGCDNRTSEHKLGNIAYSGSVIYGYPWVWWDSQLIKYKIFHATALTSNAKTAFLRTLTEYEPDNTLSDEANKQAIARVMIDLGLRYLQTRYAEFDLLKSMADELQSAIRQLDHILQRKMEEDKSIEFYRLRHKLKLPPPIQAAVKLSTALCDICWNYATGAHKKNALMNIRHEARCPYDPKQLDLCIRTYPPRRTKKSQTS